MIQIDVYNTNSLIKVDRKYRDTILGALNVYMRVDVPGAKYTWDYKSGAWDGKTVVWEDYTIPGDPAAEIAFPTGLLPIVIEALRENRHTNIQFSDHRRIQQAHLNKTIVPIRPYQYDAIKAALGNSMKGMGWWPRGVLQVATGGGKTEIAVALYEMHMVPTIFLVHRKDLLIQAKERFEKYGHNPGIIGAGKFDPNPWLTISTIQTLHKVIKNPEDNRRKAVMNLMVSAKQVFVDECHLVASTLEKGNMFTTTVGFFTGAYARWGLTATPFMRARYDNLLLEGTTGSVLYKITNDDLIKMGYLTAPQVKMRKVPGQLVVKFNGKRGNNRAAGAHWKKVKDLGIKFNSSRNSMIAEEIANGSGPILALVDTIEQGEFIRTLLLGNHKQAVKLLTGRDDADTRRKVVAQLRDGTRRAILATTIFDEGVDIPELRKVILCSGGKSQVKLLQRLGRGVRKAQGKQSVEIIDFSDTHHHMLRKHALERKKLYIAEGFQVTEER